MKFRLVLLAAAVLSLSVIVLIAPLSRREPSARLARPTAKTGGSPVTGDAVEKLQESSSRNHELLASYEREQSKLRAEVIKRRKLYQGGVLSKAEVGEAEQALISLLMRVHETRRSLIQSDLALTEAAMGDELERLPAPGADGFSETENLARFNGGAGWSLKEARRIQKFFSQTFGHELPVSAYGQTPTHDRMRFDHRDAIDVALHPDSPEGKALVKHLRGSGIPFIVFKNAVAGASTGPHIHIGRPSVRLAAK